MFGSVAAERIPRRPIVGIIWGGARIGRLTWSQE